jgi:hypothetical protein
MMEGEEERRRGGEEKRRKLKDLGEGRRAEVLKPLIAWLHSRAPSPW